MKILVVRSAALGDVILTTPVVRRLKQENRHATIGVQTAYPSVFRNSPHCMAMQELTTTSWDRIVDLELAYERHPRMPVVLAYMQEAFGDCPADIAQLRQELFYSRVFAPRSDPERPFVAVHAAYAGWRNRTLPRSTWAEVCRLLYDAGTEPILVGTSKDNVPGVEQTFFIPDILAQAGVIASCACFVGSDTALLHAAGATDTPIVGVFTSVRPDWRLPFRASCTAVVPDIECTFCHERVPPPATSESCERGDIACVNAVTAERIVEKVLDYLR